MTYPSRDQVTVATNVLRSEAGQWELQADAMAVITQGVAGRSMNRVEAGLFQGIVGPYNEVVAQVSGRCREAVEAMTEVASTLRKVADVYDEEDRSNAHRMHRLY